MGLRIWNQGRGTWDKAPDVNKKPKQNHAWSVAPHPPIDPQGGQLLPLANPNPNMQLCCCLALLPWWVWTFVTVLWDPSYQHAGQGQLDFCRNHEEGTLSFKFPLILQHCHSL